jgi:hypothetical protein
METELFEEQSRTEGFMQMGTETLGRLLDDDSLVARNEEAL